MNSSPSRVKICVVGAQSSGKSCFVTKYVQGTFSDKYDPTIEDSFYASLERQGKTIQVEILDTSGNETVLTEDMLKHWFETSDGFILVYSVIDAFTFDALPKYKQLIEKYHTKSTKTPIIVVGTFGDIESQRQVSKKEAMSLVVKWKCSLEEFSSKVNSQLDATKIISNLVSAIQLTSRGEVAANIQKKKIEHKGHKKAKSLDSQNQIVAVELEEKTKLFQVYLNMKAHGKAGKVIAHFKTWKKYHVAFQDDMMYIFKKKNLKHGIPYLGEPLEACDFETDQVASEKVKDKERDRCTELTFRPDGHAYLVLFDTDEQKIEFDATLSYSVQVAKKHITWEHESCREGEKLLQVLYRNHDNRSCVDCDGPDPDWVVLHLGCLVCMSCAAVHRLVVANPNHVSHVKSVLLDPLSESEAEVIKAIGNLRMNTIWEHDTTKLVNDNKLKKPAPGDSRTDKSDWIKAKYNEKLFLKRMEVQASQEWTVPLLLQKEYGRNRFMDFLKSEVSDENLKFWIAANELNTMTPIEQQAWISSMYAQYLKEDAPEMVNLPSNVYKDIQAHFKSHKEGQYDPTVFHAASKTIVADLEHDSWKRFIRSDQFTNFLADAHMEALALKLWSYASSNSVQEAYHALCDGAEANFLNPECLYQTPLHSAVIKGFLLMSQLLVLHGGSVTKLDAKKHTPLFYASQFGHKKVLSLLLSVHGRLPSSQQLPTVTLCKELQETQTSNESVY